jgi:hypothetical protein
MCRTRPADRQRRPRSQAHLREASERSELCADGADNTRLITICPWINGVDIGFLKIFAIAALVFFASDIISLMSF